MKWVTGPGVCEGSDLKVQMHEGYQETGGYDLVEGMTRTEGSCCDDEKGTSYTCSPSPSSLFKSRAWTHSFVYFCL